MSWFSSKEASRADSSDPTAGRNFWPITSYAQGFGQLSDQDTEWACETGKGFRSETQTWYSLLADDSALMVQIIWSNPNIVFVSPTTQMTFMLYNPKTKQTVWKSVNVGSWKPNGRSGTSDHFEIKHSGTASASGEETYHVTAKLDQDVQIDVKFTRPQGMPGCKLGEGPDGGFSYLGGKDRNDPKRDGYIVHRFHPMVKSSGHVIIGGKAIDATGEAMFVHAIQGIRPDSAAARWNFAFFASRDTGELGSVRAIQMEFTTTDAYGPKGSKSGRTKVNVGAVYASNRSAPLLVVGETQTPSDSAQYDKVNNDVSSAVQSEPVSDKDTGYPAPGRVQFKWAGSGGSKERVEASIETPLGYSVGEGGLIEKKNVLAELPYPIRKVINATGTKPFIYQYHNPVTLNLSIDGQATPVSGWMFNEASFVSQ